MPAPRHRQRHQHQASVASRAARRQPASEARPPERLAPRQRQGAQAVGPVEAALEQCLGDGHRTHAVQPPGPKQTTLQLGVAGGFAGTLGTGAIANNSVVRVVRGGSVALENQTS